MNERKKRTLRKPNETTVDRLDSPDDYTSDRASERVFYVNLGIVRYGTSDKLQGAALLLAIVLLPLIFICILIGFFWDQTWAKEALNWLGTPFLLVIGVAVGRGSRNLGDGREDG